MARGNNDIESAADSAARRSLFGLAEALGQVFSPRGDDTKAAAEETALPAGKKSLEALTDIIRKDYETVFWATGNGNFDVFDEDCLFADPFSSFRGLKRFKANAENLGKFVIDPKLRVTKCEVARNDAGEDVVIIGWSYSSKLKLPWRPVLAAAGETSHTVDSGSGLVREYREAWRSDVWEVVFRLLKPSK